MCRETVPLLQSGDHLTYDCGLQYCSTASHPDTDEAHYEWGFECAEPEAIETHCVKIGMCGL